ncbi:hypothetical protein ACFSBH_01480 [Oceanobacillus luteolus]|uniref:Uncharacterized protein n=1 Tax=Oceanobacillus luteolus TaxID=1274358 RepID=A0ABW4HMJ2_9BACI
MNGGLECGAEVIFPYGVKVNCIGKITVVYFPGWAGNKSLRENNCGLLSRMGWK